MPFRSRSQGRLWLRCAGVTVLARVPLAPAAPFFVDEPPRRAVARPMNLPLHRGRPDPAACDRETPPPTITAP
jgi:hypothetical protein